MIFINPPVEQMTLSLFSTIPKGQLDYFAAMIFWSFYFLTGLTGFFRYFPIYFLPIFNL